MSTVAPMGQVRLFANIPLDNKYEDTIYFSDKSEQTSYFTSLTPVHYMGNATRFKEGIIKVDADEDKIRHCNYMMFQNMNFNNKWFYAFITGTEYVNNKMTYVYYEIDVIQTWLYDGLTLFECMIERQHAESDALFSNILPEDIGAPELIVDKAHIKNTDNSEIGFSKDMSCVVFSSVAWDNDTSQFESSDIECVNGVLGCVTPLVQSDYIVDGTVVPAAWYVFENVLQAVVNQNKGDSIIGGVCMPTEFCRYTQESQGRSIYYLLSNFIDNFDGYTPKNNKMYNSPYNVIRLQASDGQSVFLKPELIDSDTYISFRCIPVVNMNPEILVYPLEYKGQHDDFEDAISFNKFPQFSFAIDGYKAWVASGGLATNELQRSQAGRSASLDKEQNTANTILGVTGGLSETAIGGATAYVTGGAMGLSQIASGVTNTGKTLIEGEFNRRRIEQNLTFTNENLDLQLAIAKSFSPSVKGQTSQGALASDYHIGFSVDRLTPKYQQAKAIDDYFTMYGYKQNKLAVPNLHARSRFTYIKTSNCKIEGGAPTSDITTVENIFNAGIRFWVDPSDIGNYTSPNNTLS